MEWLTAIRKSIEYIEGHLRDNISAQDVAEQVHISPLHFQRVFLIMTGYSVSEYIRNRKLYLAALDLINVDRKVIDVAYDYGYDTPDSFTKAFTYLIAGKYTGGEVPEGMMLYEFEQGEWAVFDWAGAIPDALQSLNTRIFKEWLPGNPDYEISGNANVEWYDCVNGEKTDADYHSAIWILVKRK